MSEQKRDVVLTIVDVAETARRVFGEDLARTMFPDRPKHDWRFHAETEQTRITFAADSTAEDVMLVLKRDGLLDRVPKESGVP